MKTPASTKIMIHENSKEAEPDIFQELNSTQILLILPDPSVSFQLEYWLIWLRCKYWKEITKSWEFFSIRVCACIYMFSSLGMFINFYRIWAILEFKVLVLSYFLLLASTLLIADFLLTATVGRCSGDQYVFWRYSSARPLQENLSSKFFTYHPKERPILPNTGKYLNVLHSFLKAE